MYPSGIAPAPLTRDLIAGSAAFLLPIVGGAALGIALASLIGQPPWGDQSMYLMAAGKALDGLRFGRDIVDVNPPLILWFSELPAIIARMTGILPQSAMQVVLGLLTLISLTWCLLIVRRQGRPLLASATSWWLAALLLYATTIHPWYHLGTREHIFLVLALPYLFHAAQRLKGRDNIPRWQGILAGLAAVAGCGMKPHHLLTVAAVEGLLIARAGGLRSVIRPEAIGIVSGGIIYCISIALLTPEYFTVVFGLAYDAYLDRGRAAWSKMLLPVRLLKIGVAILLWFYLRRLSEQRALADVLMTAALAAMATYLLQQKGFEYQLVPALAFLHLSLGVTIGGIVAPRLRYRLSPVPARAVPVAVIAALAVGAVYYPIQASRAAMHWSDARKHARLAIVPHIPAGTTVFMLSPEVGPLHDYLLRNNLHWGSRFTVMFTTEALMTRDLSTPRNAALARWTLDAVIEDLERYRPGVILVDRCHDPVYPVCRNHGGTREDLLGWFLRDRAFAAAWARYDKRRQVGPYEIWCPIDDDGACRALLTSLPRS